MAGLSLLVTLCDTLHYFNRQPNSSASVGKLACVIQQVVHHLSQPDWIGDQVHRLRRRRNLQVQPFVLTQRARGSDGVVHDGGYVDVLRSKFNLAAVDTVHIKKVVHEPHHLSNLTLHHLNGGGEITVRGER